MSIAKILVPIDFSPCSDAALDHALAIADECGAEVEVLHVWSPRDRVAVRAESGEDGEPRSIAIFADTPEGVAMEARLSAAEWGHAARVCGRLEFGEEAGQVILDILARESFDLVVMGIQGNGHHAEPAEPGAPSEAGETGEAGAPSETGTAGPVSGRVAATVAKTTACRVVTTTPPSLSPDETEAA